MEWEFYLLNYIQEHFHNDFLDKLMPLISMLGFLGILWVVIAAAALITKKYRAFGISLSVDLLVNLVICNAILKPIVNRIRPYDLNNTVSLLVAAEIDPSFPSGHTFFAFGAATVFFFYNKKVGILMYLLAAAIAFSRLYLYIHFPSDVAFGAFFGIITAVIAHYMEKMVMNFKKPSEQTEE